MTSLIAKRNKRIRQLPQSLVIGPQRAGTTWIHQYLESRGDVCLPRGVKETYFFDRHYSRGVIWYAKHFCCSQNARRTVEVGPTYFHSEEATTRVLDTLGRVPLVCTLRHPARRLFSLYLHYRRYGMTKYDFRTTLEKFPDLWESARYATHLRRWQDAFGQQAVLVMFLENLKADPHAYAGRLCDHLELPFRPAPPELLKPVNQVAAPPSHLLAQVGQTTAEYARKLGLYGFVTFGKSIGLKKICFGADGQGVTEELASTDQQWLLRSLQPEIEDLEVLLHTDLSHWKERESLVDAA